VAAAAAMGSLHVSSSTAVPVPATVNISSPLLTLPPGYLGATLDWWPPNSPEANFGPVGAFHLDFSSPRLRGLASALGPMTLRLGGSLDNVVQYLPDDSDPTGPAAEWCKRPIIFRNFNYSDGLCLNGTQWSRILDFASTGLAPGSKFIFGLQLDLGADGNGPWNGTAVQSFLNATGALPAASILSAVEVGEETNPAPGSAGWTALLDAYAGVRAALDAAWPAGAPRPLIHGPCSGMNENTPPFTWSSAFVAAAFPPPSLSSPSSAAANLVDAFVMHSYNNDGGGGAWARPGFLNQTAAQASGLRALLDKGGAGSAGAPLVCGECGPHNGGGIENVTDSTESSFWYADALLGLPLLGVTSFARQSLTGGWYGLLRSDTLEPNPDYYVALAYATLLGPRVLAVSTSDAQAGSLRVYAQCAKAGGGAVAVAWINIDPSTTFNVSVAWASGEGGEGELGGAARRGGRSQQRLEYHFAPAGGDVRSTVLTLNGSPLSSPGNTPPPLTPVMADAGGPIAAAPLSFGFAVFPDAGAPACA
jgi:heparanase